MEIPATLVLAAIKDYFWNP